MPWGTRSRASCRAMVGTPGATATASIRPFGQMAQAALHALLPPRSIPTMGRPAGGGTGRPSTSSQSPTVNSTCCSSSVGRFSLKLMNAARAAESVRASSRSSSSLARDAGYRHESGDTRRISLARSHFARSAWRK